jgi:hypothetical protein
MRIDYRFGAAGGGDDSAGGSAPRVATAIDVTPASTGITINNAGSGNAHNNVQPVNYLRVL